jgi:hypothetical protein
MNTTPPAAAQPAASPAPAAAGAPLRILVATSRTQGQRANDFNWIPDGEPVYLGMQCDGERPDDRCGCARAWTGMTGHKAGTTATVAVTTLTREAYRAAFGASLLDAGWDIPPADIDDMAGELLDIAAQFDPGTILEHRGTQIRVRTPRR